MKYLDFDIEIGKGQGREYPVAVVASPGGEGRETMRFPYDELQLENRLLHLQNALLRSGGKQRKSLSPQEQTIQTFGQDLFKALLTGELLSLYRVSRREAEQQNKGLRVKLRIQAPDLAALPWEFLYDPNDAEYLCLSRETPVVRYLELPQPPRPLKITPPLQILAMVASPTDLQGLDTAQEKERMTRALANLEDEGLVELTWLEGETWRDLQKALRRKTFHVFHFIGHGGFDTQRDEGLISFCNSQGKAEDFSATKLARLLADYRSLRLVVLNACEGARGSGQDVFSSTASILVQRKLPAVLAMQYAITDRAAIELARSFYEALADGLPVDTAVGEARKGMSFAVTNTVEWGTPVLFMRAPDGQLFEMAAAPTSTSPISAPEPLPVVQPAVTQQQSEQPLKQEPEQLPEPKPQADPVPDSQEYLVSLVGKIGDTFNEEELRMLCFRLEVDYDDLGGKTKSGNARQLVAYCRRHNRLGQLVAELEALRPGTNWRQLPDSPLAQPARQIVAKPTPPIDTQAQYDEPDWVEIPAGKFWMGSEKGNDNEKPIHQVYLDTYQIGRTPITNAQYQLFVAATGHNAPGHWQNGKVPQALVNHPVVYVKWYDALAYCRWLSEVTGKEIALPSEAEWEKAARGDKDKREYPWGDAFDPKRANTSKGGPGKTTAVGSYPQGASPYGVLDMSGNVWQWTRSIFKGYPYQPVDGRENLEDTSSSRVVRGGSWAFDPYHARVASRNGFRPVFRINGIGFRVVVRRPPSHEH